MFLTLPTEFFGFIVDGLDTSKDLNAFLQAYPHLYNHLNPRLYRLGAEGDSDVSPLCWAIKNDQTSTLQLLLSYGANPFPRSLFYAISYGRKSIVLTLLEKGANIKSTFMGCSPLYAAISTHIPINDIDDDTYEEIKTAVLRVLLEKGAEVGARDEDHETALISLVKQSSPNLNSLKLLLNHSADVNAEYNEDITVLHEAAQAGNLNVIKMLVQHCANVDASSCTGDGEPRSPLEWWAREWATCMATFKDGSGVKDGKEIFALLKPTG
jgi:ankyrin repeat protein